MPANDTLVIEVGESGSGNILANDTLGSPGATLDPTLVLGDGITVAEVGSQFVVLTLDGIPVATATVFSDGTIVFTGTAEGRGVTAYRLLQGGVNTPPAAFDIVVLPTTSTSTTSTTTVPVVVAVPADDSFVVEVGASGSGNILANDTLGSPSATLDPDSLLTAGGAGIPVPVGSQFEVLTSEGSPVATTIVSSDGTIVFTGTAEGTGVLTYALVQDGGGRPAATVLIDVTLPPV